MSIVTRTKTIMYSIDTLKLVKPEPSLKQSGKNPSQTDKIRKVVNKLNKENTTRSLSFVKNSIRKNPSTSSDLPAIQS